MHTTNFEAKNNTYLSSHSVDVGRHVTVWLSCFSALGLTGVSRAVIPPGSSGDELLLRLLAARFCAVALSFPFPCRQSTAILSFQRPPIPWLIVPFLHLSSQQQQAGFSSGFKSLWPPCATFFGRLICLPFLLLRIMRCHWAHLDSPACLPCRKVNYLVTLIASAESLHISTTLVFDGINQKTESWRNISRILQTPSGYDSHLTSWVILD